MKKYLKHITLLLLYIILNIFYSILYLNSDTTYNIISKFIIITFLFFYVILNFFFIKRSNSKAIVCGLKIGVVTILIFLIMSFILKCSLSFKSIIYYLILLMVSITSCVIFKNIKKDSN